MNKRIAFLHIGKRNNHANVVRKGGKDMKKRFTAVLLALLLALNVVSVNQLSVQAEGAADEVTTEEIQEESSVQEEVDEEEVTVKQEPVTEVASEDQTAEVQVTEEAKTLEEGKGSSLKLLYGDESLADEDALVLLVLGDGFTADEQDSFFNYAQTGANYLAETSPWDEFAKNIKIYAIGTVSNESGARGDSAANYNQALADTRDTYYGATYWSGGTQRIMNLEKKEKVAEIKAEYGIESDGDIILVNSKTEGGTSYLNEGYVILSVDAEVYNCIVHELGHLIGGLADEYWAHGSEKYPNMTQESDPAKVKWARFVGLNGVGVYEYDGAGAGWYRPSQTCKMQLLKNDFCEVCKEALRDAIAGDSNITSISFQTYADQFYEEATGKDMSEYFILRKGTKKATGDTLGEDLQLTYTDSEGKEVAGIPNKAGTYTVTANFKGNAEFDPCTLSGTYTIQYPNLITIDVASKTYDGKPAEMSYTVEGYEPDEYDAVVTYSGTFPYSKDKTQTYESTEAPVIQGKYTVTVEIHDKETGDIITRKSKEFEINFGTVTLVENSDPSWPGSSSAYSNFTYYIFGDGYTAEEQDKFIEDAKEFVRNFLLQDPYREMSSYFNFYAVPTPSDTSGISNPDGDTYFGLSLDADGKIVASKEAGTLVQTIAYDKLDPYYRTVFVIANDENAKSGTYYNGYHGAVFTTADADGAKYAATIATNLFVSGGKDPDYDYEHVAESEEELAKQKALFLEWLAYSSYTMILTDTYRADFKENGEPVDITDYLHTYNASIEIPNSMLEYAITYYADNQGEVGEELEEAPSEPGTYHAFISLVPNSGTNRIVNSEFASIGINARRGLYITKAWTSFTIGHADAVRIEAVEPTYDEGGNTAYWYCSYCGKYFADNDGIMDESVAYDDNSEFLLAKLEKDPAETPGTDPAGKKDPSKDNNSSKKDKKKAVQTGDESDMALWILLLGCSGMFATVTVYRRRKNAR